MDPIHIPGKVLTGHTPEENFVLMLQWLQSSEAPPLLSRDDFDDFQKYILGLFADYRKSGAAMTGDKFGSPTQSLGEIAIGWSLDMFRAYAAAGGPESDELSMCAIDRGPEFIAAYKAAGFSFRLHQDENGLTPLMRALRFQTKESFEKSDAVRAYLKAEGPLSSLGDRFGKTEAHYVVDSAVSAFGDFMKAGGTLSDVQDVNGYTAPMSVLAGGEANVTLYRAGGGPWFPDKQDKQGRTEMMIAIVHPAFEAYLQQGGFYTNLTDNYGNREEAHAASRSINAMRIFAKYGGKFTNWSNKAGKTSRDAAIKLAGNLSKQEILATYDALVEAQGGLVQVPLIPAEVGKPEFAKSAAMFG